MSAPNPALFQSRNTPEFGVIESDITLRDLFAMAALLSRDLPTRPVCDTLGERLGDIAWASYAIADAMLAERAKK